MSEPAPAPADVITATLLQITQQAERVAALDEREAGHYQQIAARLSDLARVAEATSERTTQMHAATLQQADIVNSLDGLDREVEALASRIAWLAEKHKGHSDGEEDGGYQPPPAPRWWKLQGPQRQEALARLHAWIEQIYRPGYGHLAAALGPCWDQHPLCLYGLDWLMELWSVLYLPPERKASTLASQAEWQTRLLPAFAEQMYLETTRCPHAKANSNHTAASAASQPRKWPPPSQS